MRYPAMYPMWSLRTDINPELVPLPDLNSSASIGFGNQDVLFNVDQVAVDSLEDQYAALVARRIGGAVAKEILAERIRKENQLLGDLALIAMYASDRADLRQWSTLPKNFKIYRASVPAGDYQLRISGQIKAENLHLKAGEKVFINQRTF
jgi:hypothetical protein